jgi:N-acylglucosamine 2-epimerase
MKPDRASELLSVYRDGLLDETIPFWLAHGLDHEHGGYFTAVDRDGSVIDTDKSVWFQGRFAWMLSTLCTRVEKRQQWLDAAKLGIDFLREHCFDTDGQMFFIVTREGLPLRKRRYCFSETFAIAALAAYAKAAGDERARSEAGDLYRKVIRYFTTPGLLEPKVNPKTRPMKGLVVPMIMIVTSQILREVCDESLCNEWIDRSIAEIERDFMHPEFKAVLEVVGPGGEFIDHYDGRTINPGHSIEAAWFILEESRHPRHTPERAAALRRTALTILDWMWEWGWDKEHGGITYFRDVRNLPVQEYWHDMKFWWPQNETIIATLMAHLLTGDEKYERWHKMAHDWAYAKFHDSKARGGHGEWFGYLHRDGSVSSQSKGTLWKGPFHYPRMQLVCWKLLEEMGPRG